MKKEKISQELARVIEILSNKMEKINEGDMDFSEAGDWLHNYGDVILNSLENASDYILKTKEAV